ncbi:MAG: hypothetical protein IPL34_18440 [Thiofilum sp.]|uniref:hypothetical protein n=1 Tax=Thiofilum sp. TaxID=2212733 RepID=UPI0025D1787B|nr:hypothetical protein [Thiofilum sp.]MBK8455272.1 hypothetical protein [Thiofilum sp.]
MNNFLDQLMSMLGSLQIGRGSATTQPNNQARITHNYNGGQSFQVSANRMPLYNPNLPSGTPHLPAQSQGCFMCVAKKNIFGGLLGAIR